MSAIKNRIYRFNPFCISDDIVSQIETGRDQELTTVMEIIKQNIDSNNKRQVIIINGPRGIGKSFFLRSIQLRVERIAGWCLISEQEVLFVSFQQLMQTVLEYQHSNKHLVLAIERIDVLWQRDPEFKTFFNSLRSSFPMITLIGTTLSCDNHEINEISQPDVLTLYLKRWQTSDIETFLQKSTITAISKDQIESFAKLTGGFPRTAALLVDLFEQTDIDTTFQYIENIIDYITPYYHTLISSMSETCYQLFYLLNQKNTPCTLPELMNSTEIKAETDLIRDSIDWLKQNGFICETQKDNSTYIICDRLLAYFYRTVYLPSKFQLPIYSRISEFISTLYNPEKIKKQAEQHFGNGNTDTALILLHIAMASCHIDVDSLVWKDDVIMLLSAIELMEKETVILPNSSQKAKSMTVLMRDLLTATLHAPLNMERSLFAKYLFGSLAFSFNAKVKLFQQCIKNKIPHENWIKFFECFSTERKKIENSLGEPFLKLMDAISEGEILIEILYDNRIEQLKKMNKPVYYALIAGYKQDLKFKISSEEILEAHKYLHSVCSTESQSEAWHLEQIGLYSCEFKEYEAALKVYQRACSIWKTQENKAKYIWNLGQIGWTLQHLNKFEEAIQAHQNAIEISESLDDLFSKAWNLGRIGRILGILKRHKESLDTHQQALDILEKIDNTELKIWNMGRIGRCFAKLMRHSEALDIHRQASKLAESSDDIASQAWNLEGMSWHLGKLDRHEEAIASQDKALKLRAKEGNIARQAWNLEGIGWYKGKIGDYEEAITSLERAFKLRTIEHNAAGQAWNLEGISRFLGELKLHEEAIKMHEKAIELQIREGNALRHAWNLRGIGWNLKEIGLYDKVLTTLLKALELSEDNFWKAVHWSLIGANLTELGRYVESIQAHEKAVDFWNKEGNLCSQAENIGQIVINLLMTRRREQAWQVLDENVKKFSQFKYHMIRRLGDVVFYIEKNRNSLAYSAGVEIMKQLYLRKNTFETKSSFHLFFMCILKRKIKFKLLSDLFDHVSTEYFGKIKMDFDILNGIVTFLRSGRSWKFLLEIPPEKRQKVENLIDDLDL